MRFPIILHKDKTSDYGVIVPDLPGCFSAGSTVDEALEMAKEAIESHIEFLLEEGDTIPEQQDVEIHLANPDYAGGRLAYVDVDPVALLGKTLRYNLTLPELLVQRVDQYVNNHPSEFRSRSDFFAHLGAEYFSKAKSKPTDGRKRSRGSDVLASSKVAKSGGGNFLKSGRNGRVVSKGTVIKKKA